MRPDVVTVAVTRVDGGLTIMRVVKSGADVTAQYVDSLIAKYVGQGQWVGGQLPVTWRFVPNDYVPEGLPKSERYFRNAWKDDGGNKPGVDMPKAREVHRNQLRRLRAPVLEALDNEYMMADEAGDQLKKRTIAAKKQALRDVTEDPRIEAAQTPEQLRAVTI